MTFEPTATAAPQLPDGEKAARIEEIFLTTESTAFNAVYVTSELPPLVIARLEKISWPLAEWGQPFSDSDIPSTGPYAGHVISFVSPDVSIVVYQQGGFTGVNVMALLVDHNWPYTCRYYLGKELGNGYTLKRLQSILNPSKSGRPVCELK